MLLTSPVSKFQVRIHPSVKLLSVGNKILLGNQYKLSPQQKSRFLEDNLLCLIHLYLGKSFLLHMLYSWWSLNGTIDHQNMG